MVVTSPDIHSSTHVFTVHNSEGTYAVCYEVPDVSKPKQLGRVWTVAKLDRGAPQIRYVHPEYPGRLTGPTDISKSVARAIEAANIQATKERYTNMAH